jgi:hypothetical protein
MVPLLFLDFTAVDNDGLWPFVLHVARASTDLLQGLDHLERFFISHLTENDMFAIEPASDDSSDEKLRTIAVG